jgi:hypothetical protein
MKGEETLKGRRRREFGLLEDFLKKIERKRAISLNSVSKQLL